MYRKWIERIIYLIIVIYSSYILYNTKILAIQKQSNIEQRLNQSIQLNMLDDDVKKVAEDKPEPKDPSRIKIGESELSVKGILYIPKIGLKLGIYEGTSEEALRNGAGILDGTGDLNTKENGNTVLTSHNGDDKQALFMNLTKLSKGDRYLTKDGTGTIRVYKVKLIKTVLPTNVLENLLHEPKVKILTMLTCVPQGINSHRLLVQGEEIEKVTLTELQQNQEKLQNLEIEMHKADKLIFSTYEIIIICLNLFGLIMLLLTFIKKSSITKMTKRNIN